MDLIEALKLSMRQRIVPEIVPARDYQREWMTAPTASSLYVRETFREDTREENSQTTELLTVLCEYDIFVSNGAFPDPMREASNVASKILSRFYVKDPRRMNIPILGYDEIVHASVARYQYGTPQQETELFELPVLIYVELLITTDLEMGSA